MSGRARAVGRRIYRSFNTWLAMAERRQLRRVRLWDPRPGDLRERDIA